MWRKAANGPTWMNDFALSVCADPSWLLIEDSVDPAREREIGALLAIGNGYLSARASIPEGSRFSRPAIFVAGIYVADRDFGPRLAVLPPWLHVEVIVRGSPTVAGSGASPSASTSPRPQAGNSVAGMAAAGPEWTHHAIDLFPVCFARRPEPAGPIGDRDRRKLCRQDRSPRTPWRAG